MVAIINAINMIDGLDGLDGLAGTVVLQILLWFLFLNLYLNQSHYFIFLIPATAMIIAYLRFNFRWSKHAQVFMGDGGSMLLGLVIAWFSITYSQAPISLTSPSLFLWILALPLYDAGHVILQRFRQNKSLFYADRQHLHHTLQDLNYGQKSTVMIINLLSFLLSTTGFVLAFLLKAPEPVLFSGFLTGFFCFIWGNHYLRKKLI